MFRTPGIAPVVGRCLWCLIWGFTGGSAGARPICSLSLIIIPGGFAATVSGSLRTLSGWVPLCSRHWPAAGSQPVFTAITDMRSSMPVFCGRARNSKCALFIRLHTGPGAGVKIERFFRTVREQFLVEITDTSAEDLAATVSITGPGCSNSTGC